MTTSVDPQRPGTRPSDDESLRLQFERDAIWNRMVSAGDRVPDIPLLEVDFGVIHLDRMRQTGPLVLVFFRHAGSLPCEAALRGYQHTLLPALAGADAHLVAVSPQVPDRLEAVKRRHDLGFFVASDPRHRLIDALNIGFTGSGAAAVLGSGRSVLPFATVVVADRAGVVRFADVHADWTAVTAPGAIVRAVRGIKPARPAA